MKKQKLYLWMIGTAILVCSAPIDSVSQSPYLSASVKSARQISSLPVSYPNLAIPVTGKILNDKGEPLAGATIVVKGSNINTTTDGQGAEIITLLKHNQFEINDSSLQLKK